VREEWFRDHFLLKFSQFQPIDFLYTHGMGFYPTMTLEKGKPREIVGRKATGLSPELKG
jgi:hypothetical protein